MWIKIIAAFIDKEAADPADANVPAGKKLNVTADRGQHLVDLGLAELADAEEASDQPAAGTSSEAKKGARRAEQE